MLGVSYMDINLIWKEFLNNIENQISYIMFETYFKETKLISLKDSIATVLVPMHVYKKYLKENYNDFIEEVFTNITGTNFKFEYLTEEELEDNITIDTNDVGVPSTSTLESNLKQEYTFDNFIVGNTNKFAKATALAVAEKPGYMYNPLFIYGNSGLGKTHLMHAIGNYIVKNAKKNVLYVTSEQFVNEFIDLYRLNKDDNNIDEVRNFKKKYRDIDVLMIDDIQYLQIASKAQQEFFNTFNDLYNNNKQIIISSDRSPDDLKSLEDRLKTRFNWGLTIDILPPDFDLRFAIITKLIEGNNVVFPDDCKEYIASNCIGDIRKLEGAVTRVLAY